MRADEGTLPALDAQILPPGGHLVGDVAFFPSGRAGREGAIGGQKADRDLVAAVLHHRRGDAADKFGRGRRHGGRAFEARGDGAWHFHLLQPFQRAIDRGPVLLDHPLALAAIGFLDRGLDLGDRVFAGKHARKRKETGLQDGVGAPPQPHLARGPVGVDDVKLQPLVNDRLLRGPGQAVPDRVGPERRVQKHRRPRCRDAQDVDFRQEGELVAGDEIRLMDQIGRLDRPRPEAQMRHRLRAGLVAVIDEIALRTKPRLLGQDLDRVLVRAHRAIGAKAEKDRANNVFGLGVEIRIDGQAGEADIIGDADRKALFRGVLRQLVVNRLHLRRVEILRRQPITAARDARHHGPFAGGHRFGQGGHDIQEQGLAGRTRFLAAIQHRKLRARRGQGGQKRLGREGAVKPHHQRAEFFARGVQRRQSLFDHLGARAHDDDHPFRFGVAQIIDQPIAPPGQIAQPRHFLGHDPGHGGVERIARLAALKEHIRVLRRAAHHRIVGRKRAGAMGAHQIIVDHRPDRLIGDQPQRVDLVAGAETIEEMHKRHAGAQSRRLRDQRHVMGLLHGSRGQHRKARRPHRHHIGMIAKDRERMGGKRPRGHMKDRRRQLARDLEHVRDHQHQPLRGGEGRRHRAGLQRPMHGARRPGLGLHFLNDGHIAPDVADLARGPFVGQLRHRGRRRDRIDAADLVHPIGDVGHRGIAVHHRLQPDRGGGVVFGHAVTHRRPPRGSSQAPRRGIVRRSCCSRCISSGRSDSRGRGRA